MLARLGAVTEVHFVHVLSDAGESAPDPEAVRAEMGTTVRAAFAGPESAVPMHFDVLRGHLLDRLLEHAAERGWRDLPGLRRR